MKFLLCTLALSLGVAYADFPVNTINNGSIIKAGTYFNTQGQETIFKNSAGTGIQLQAGQNITGVELFENNVTGNGGSIHIEAPRWYDWMAILMCEAFWLMGLTTLVMAAMSP